MTFEVKTDVELGPMTTLGIGGPARFFVVVKTEDEVEAALSFAEKRSLDVFVLGGGSNLLVADAGFDGLVIQIGLKGIAPGAGDGMLTVGAGEDWDGFVAYCVDNDLAGVECLSGIPGFVGGTPIQNVGAYGQEVSETIRSVRCYDRRERRFVELSDDECRFEYRKSIFNSTERNRYVVTSVSYCMKPGGEPKIVYRDLIEHFAGRVLTLAETREAVLEIRRAKSMVIDPEDPNSRSAGSFFKNPIVPKGLLDQLRVEHPNMPSFPVDDATVKIPAAWLIENAGFQKGFVSGNAGLSANHTLAVINRGGATAGDILDLKAAISRGVLERFGIELHPEPVFLGFDG